MTSSLINIAECFQTGFKITPVFFVLGNVTNELKRVFYFMDIFKIKVDVLILMVIVNNCEFK